jgi:hypothetical protein
MYLDGIDIDDWGADLPTAVEAASALMTHITSSGRQRICLQD